MAFKRSGVRLPLAPPLSAVISLTFRGRPRAASISNAGLWSSGRHQQRSPDWREGRKRQGKDQLGATDGDTDISLLAAGFSDRDRGGGNRQRAAAGDFGVVTVLSARADRSDPDQQKCDEVLHVIDRDREAHHAPVEARCLHEQRGAIRRRSAVKRIDDWKFAVRFDLPSLPRGRGQMSDHWASASSREPRIRKSAARTQARLAVRSGS
jgi:hypothetical protein